MNTRLLNRLAIIEYNNLKGICPFVFKSIESQNKSIKLNDFYIHNDYLHLNNKSIDGAKKFIWQPRLYFKNGFNHEILLFDHLKNKYRIK